MALPRKLKLMNLMIDGGKFLGTVNEVTQPKLAMKAEEYRAGGQIAPVDINMGLEKLEAEFKMGGYMVELIRKFGATIDGMQMRFMGAYEQDDSGDVTSVELVMRGRFSEIDPGNSKVGDDTEQNFKVPLTYYKIIVDGKELVEIDALNTIFIVDGVDKLAEHRAAIGL